MNKKTFIYLLEGAAVSAVSTAIMILLFVKGYGDFCHPESAAFLQLYTEKGKSLLQIIFNPWYTDWGCYQARELSYFFDWCDAQFIKACISEGHTHFFSLVNALFIVATALVLYFGFLHRMPKLKRAGAALLTLFFIVAPATSSSTLYFRSSKPATAFGIAVAGISAWSLIRRKDKIFSGNNGAWLSLSLSLLLLPYFDRQGMFFVSIFCIGSGFVFMFLQLKSVSPVFSVTKSDFSKLVVFVSLSAFSVIFATFYNLLIGPGLIHYFNKYDPSFFYQNMGRGLSFLAILNFSRGLHYFLGNIGFAVSRWPGYGALAIGTSLVAVAVLLCFRYARKKMEGYLLLIVVVMTLGAMIILANIMTARHPALLQPDVIYSGYFVPTLVVLLILLAISIEITGDEITGKIRIFIYALLSVIIALNTAVIAIGKTESDRDTDFYHIHSRELIRCLNNPDRDPEKVKMPYSFLQLIRYFRTEKK